MSNDSKKTDALAAPTLHRTDAEQLELFKQMCESLLKQSNYLPDGGKDAVTFCKRVDEVLEARDLPKIQQPVSSKTPPQRG